MIELSNYYETTSEFDDIKATIEEIKKVSEENILLINNLTLNDLEILKKQTEYNILYIIYLEKNILELEERANKCKNKMNQKDKYNKYIDRIDDDSSGIIVVTVIVAWLMSLIYTGNFMLSMIISFIMTNIVKLSMSIAIQIFEEKAKLSEEKIYQKEIDIIERGIELLKSIKKIYEEENTFRYKKIEELTALKASKENKNIEFDTRIWANNIFRENNQYSKKRILRKTNKNKKYFDY